MPLNGAPESADGAAHTLGSGDGALNAGGASAVDCSGGGAHTSGGSGIEHT
jgi:hypothetical protein